MTSEPRNSNADLTQSLARTDRIDGLNLSAIDRTMIVTTIAECYHDRPDP